MVLVYIFGALLGLCFGSFLNVLIYRVPNGMNIATPPSHCPNCDYMLKWYDNIPVLSYIILGGKCRNCKTHISFRYTAVEIINTLLWVACIYVFWGTSIPLACFCACACSILLCMFCTDLETRTVPDSFQIALALFAVGVTVFDKSVAWYSHLIGAAVFGIVFWVVAFFVGKKVGQEALGGGDIKLAAAAGLLLGWEKMLAAMLVSTVAGSVIILIIRRAKKNGKTAEYPFVPFMAVGILIMLFFGDSLIDLYMNIIYSFLP